MWSWSLKIRGSVCECNTTTTTTTHAHTHTHTLTLYIWDQNYLRFRWDPNEPAPLRGSPIAILLQLGISGDMKVIPSEFLVALELTESLMRDDLGKGEERAKGDDDVICFQYTCLCMCFPFDCEDFVTSNLVQIPPK